MPTKTPAEAAGNPFADVAGPEAEQPDPSIMPGPPKTEAEVQQRVGGWQRFLSRLESDPTLLMGVMRFGTQLMQPIAPGQTGAGHFGAALQDSTNFALNLRAQNERAALERARTGADVERSGAQTAQIRQATGQQAQTFPSQLSAAQLAVKKAQYDVDQIEAEGAAGLRSPEWLQKKANADMAKQDALTALYNAHASYYGSLGKAAVDKTNATRQLLHSTKVENLDGTTTIVNTHAVNGRLYMETYTPPRFTDPAQAQVQAQKDTDKITPFFGRAPYSGTKAAEVARRAKQYLTAQRVIVGPGGQQISPQQFEQLDAQQPPNGPAPARRPGPNPQPVGLTPAESAADVDHDASPANVEELKRTIAGTKDPRIKEILQNELNNIVGPTADAAQPIKVTRGADGKLQVASPAKAEAGAPKTLIPWQDIPAPPPNTRGAAAKYAAWKAKYGESFDALSERTKRSVRLGGKSME
jgi:hypothetical protein